MDGTKLVTIHDPIVSDNGDLELALHGSFLPGRNNPNKVYRFCIILLLKSTHTIVDWLVETFVVFINF